LGNLSKFENGWKWWYNEGKKFFQGKVESKERPIIT